MPGFRAAELMWPACKSAIEDGEPLIVAVGSLEQHGPHLPLGTDTMIAEAVAADLAAELPGILLPSIPYRAPSRPRSGGGDRFPLSGVDLVTLIHPIEAVARGAVDSGARTLLVISWHWESAAVLWDALAATIRDRLARAILVDNPADLLGAELRAELFPEGFRGWESDHTARLETAIVRHLAPELTSNYRTHGDFRARAYDVLPTPASAVPADWVFTDPGVSDGQLGGRCLEEITTSVLAIARAGLKDGVS